MLNIENPEMFAKVIADALAAVDANSTLQTWEKMRFVNAIARATTKIEEQGVFMDYDNNADRLVIWSQKSNQIYTVNGTCQCQASANGQICWHRAAKRLWERYNEAMMAALAKPTLSDFNNAPYLKETGKKPEIFGSIRI